MSTDTPRYSPAWLALREGADAAARAAQLVDQLRRCLPDARPLVIHDLGCGTGSMGRWLAGRLPGPQCWIMHDQDQELLEHAAARMPGAAADGTPVTVRTRLGDLTRLTAADLGGDGAASLVTASALLDLLTREEVDGLAAACVGAGSPALLTLSVAGRVNLDPADPLDTEIADAFNAHQRRSTAGRRLLGPDAVDAAAEAFTRLGASVHVCPAPWRLGAAEADLAAEWLRGWVGAACEQRPDLAAAAEDYLGRRLATAAAGGLRAEIDHTDLLARSE